MKKKIIFIVEDDPGFNTLMTSYLTSRNKWEIHSFESGEKSLEKLNLKPDIFLQDIDLPGMNGIDVMKEVKKRAPATEFIFLTGHTDVKTVVSALQMGAFDYIVKDTYAKENALNKIDQVVKILNYSEEKRVNRNSNRMLIGLVILLALVLLILIFTKFI